MTKILHHYMIRKKDGLWDCISETMPKNAQEVKLEEKEIFDYYIKQSFIDGAPYLSGFILNNIEDNFGFYVKRWGRNYDRYLSKNLDIKSKLSPQISNKFKDNELQSGKFYSVASSSRFTVSSFTEIKNGQLDYIKSINGEEIIKAYFEYDAHIEGIPNNCYSPQLDFYCKTNTSTYFVEAKCHEIFDCHKSIELSPNYNNLLKTHLKKSFTEKKQIDKDGKTSKEFLSVEGNTEPNRFLLASDFDCNIKTNHFDFKQFLCHLMGIISYAKRNPKENIYFYYLIYRNELFEKETNSNIYNQLEAEMKEIFNVFGKIFPQIHFGLCYNNKYDTIKELNNILNGK